MTKQCSVCKNIKELEEFPTNGKNKDGSNKYRSDCKQCNYLKIKKYRKNNPEVIIDQQHRRYELHKDEILEKNKIYVNNNSEERKEYHKNYNIINKIKNDKRYKIYSSKIEIKQMRQKYWQDYYELNKDEILKKSATYYEKTKDKRKEYRIRNRHKLRIYQQNKYKTDPSYRLRILISCGIRKSLKIKKMVGSGNY